MLMFRDLPPVTPHSPHSYLHFTLTTPPQHPHPTTTPPHHPTHTPPQHHPTTPTPKMQQSPPPCYCTPLCLSLHHGVYKVLYSRCRRCLCILASLFYSVFAGDVRTYVRSHIVVARSQLLGLTHISRLGDGLRSLVERPLATRRTRNKLHDNTLVYAVQQHVLSRAAATAHTLLPTHTYTPSYPHTPTHHLTPTHTYTPTHPPTHPHTLLPTHTYTPAHHLTHTHLHTHTPTYTHTFPPTHPLTHTHIHTHTLSYPHTPTHPHTLLPTHTYTPTHPLTYIHLNNCTPTPSYPHTHTPTHLLTTYTRIYLHTLLLTHSQT